MKHVRERLEQELKQLERELRYELPQEIKRATALGDLRENAEYHAALERQSYVRARVGQLRQRISQLSSLDMSQIPRDRAGLGSQVVLEDLDTGEEVTYELVLAEDGDPPAGRLSISSPIGRAVAGRKIGDEITVQTPGGERSFEITGLATIHEREDLVG